MWLDKAVEQGAGADAIVTAYTPPGGQSHLVIDSLDP